MSNVINLQNPYIPESLNTSPVSLSMLESNIVEISGGDLNLMYMDLGYIQSNTNASYKENLPNTSGEIVVDKNAKHMTLNWNAQSGIKQYEIKLNDRIINILNSSDDLTCSLKRLPKGCSSKLKLIGINNSDVSQLLNNFTVLGFPNPLKYLKVKNITSNSVILKWKSWGNIMSYLNSVKIYITDGTTPVLITKSILDILGKETVIENLISNTNYQIYTTTTNSQNESINSSIVKFKTL